MFSSQTPFSLEDTLGDAIGHVLFLKGRMGELRFTFATVYCPNTAHAQFLQTVCTKLSAFRRPL